VANAVPVATKRPVPIVPPIAIISKCLALSLRFIFPFGSSVEGNRWSRISLSSFDLIQKLQFFLVNFYGNSGMSSRSTSAVSCGEVIHIVHDALLVAISFPVDKNYILVIAMLT
jgi:hypothetical protein